MKEIKVRVWDIDGGKMSAGVNIDLFMQNEEELQFPATEETLSLKDFLFFRKEYSGFMLFTGLLDKNGVEIWEGDFIQYPNKSMIMIVVFGLYSYEDEYTMEGNGFYLTYPNGIVYRQCVKSWIHNATVIGNIYQNPELLNPQP